jgi:hypothetical protein
MSRDVIGDGSHQALRQHIYSSGGDAGADLGVGPGSLLFGSA